MGNYQYGCFGILLIWRVFRPVSYIREYAAKVALSSFATVIMRLFYLPRIRTGLSHALVSKT